MPLTRYIGSRVKTFRKARNLTQGELASLVGCEKMTISRYERGAGPPNVEHLMKLAIALGVSPSELLPPTDISEAREHLPRLRDEAIQRILSIGNTDALKELIRLADFLLNKHENKE
ncbi:helix-turn-helix domain-containing protein [Pseudomonas viridiflava]|uniref:helix-turn-helix domain-containing protein n=1 Tax=Pseudomonas viridiflava TaxID=33069 RepID=UPI000F0420C4|nr:helix-turn-helix transcriptional regulator [Pseudomonas viridiflava]